MSYPRGTLAGVMVEFVSELWTWEARRTDTWTFVALPPELSDEILDRAGGLTHGFGSLKVRVRVGTTTWTTSIFPDAKRGTYVLPIKKAVRKSQSLSPGDTTEVTLELLDLL